MLVAILRVESSSFSSVAVAVAAVRYGDPLTYFCDTKRVKKTRDKKTNTNKTTKYKKAKQRKSRKLLLSFFLFSFWLLLLLLYKQSGNNRRNRQTLSSSECGAINKQALPSNTAPHTCVVYQRYFIIAASAQKRLKSFKIAHRQIARRTTADRRNTLVCVIVSPRENTHIHCFKQI